MTSNWSSASSHTCRCWRQHMHHAIELPEGMKRCIFHLRLVGSKRSDPAIQRCTVPYLTEPKLKSENTPRCIWIHHILVRMLQSGSNYYLLTTSTSINTLYCMYWQVYSIDVSFHHATGVAHLERQHGSPSIQLRMHLVQAVAVQKAHQSHQILALDSSCLQCHAPGMPRFSQQFTTLKR